MTENPSCSIGVINPCCNASNAPIWTDTFEDLCALFNNYKVRYGRKPKRNDYDSEYVQSKINKRKALVEEKVQKFAVMKARGIL